MSGRALSGGYNRSGITIPGWRSRKLEVCSDSPVGNHSTGRSWCAKFTCRGLLAGGIIVPKQITDAAGSAELLAAVVEAKNTYARSTFLRELRHSETGPTPHI